MKRFYRISFLLPVLLLFLNRAYSEEPKIEWNQAHNASGYIVEIRNSHNKTVVRKKTNETFYVIDLDPGTYRFRLIVLNRYGLEGAVSPWKEFKVVAGEKKEKGSSDRIYNITASAAYYIPGGAMGDILSPGYGGYLSMGVCNLFLDNFEAGVSAGVFSLNGEESLDIKSALHTSFRLYSGYYFLLSERFSLFPYFGGGFNYTKVSYIEKDYFTSGTVNDPAVTLGLSLVFNFGMFQIPVGVNSSALFEKKGTVYDCSVYGGLGLSF